MYYTTDYTSPVGHLTMASDGDSLTGLWLEGQKYFCGAVKERMLPKNNLVIFDAAKKWLDRYFAGKKPAISELSLAPAGGISGRRYGNCSVKYHTASSLLMEK